MTAPRRSGRRTADTKAIPSRGDAANFAQDGARHLGAERLRVAFQGELGAFSQQAIRQFFGTQAEPVPRPRFDDIFAALKSGAVDAAAVPIENTLAGSVHENYDLLIKYPFEITAETNVRVVHNLIAPPGTSFQDVRRVYSHPVALNQCLDFFARNPNIERIPFYDTAGSVKMLMEEHPSQSAAIASELAARIYKARILKRGIEDDRQNFTRFFLLEPAGAKPRALPDAAEPGASKSEAGHSRTTQAKKTQAKTTQGSRKTSIQRTPNASSPRPWKTSLVFSTKNVPGALFRALSALALRDLNLVKIESRPLRGKPWEYLFYLDLLGHRDEKNVQNALAHLAEAADFLRVLGSYRSA
jgi:prephenate dehydratase